MFIQEEETMAALTKEQAKTQLIELMQFRLADFIEERMGALEKLYTPDDQDGFFYEAVERMGWIGNKLDWDALGLSVQFTVHIEKEDVRGEDECVSHVTIHLTPSISMEERDGVTRRLSGVSNQKLRECGVMRLRFRLGS